MRGDHGSRDDLRRCDGAAEAAGVSGAARAKHREKVKTVVADAQYGTNENFATCQERKIRSHMKDFRSLQKNDAAKRGIYKQKDFRYDPETQTYLCPAGERLKPTGRIDRGFQIFQSNRNVCQHCSLRTKCTRSKRQIRTLKRHVAHEAIERARLESHSGWGRRDRKRRHHLMEGSFADAANHHGFKRARWRRLPNQRIQDLLIAACQNIRILMGNPRRPVAAAMKAVQSPARAQWASRAAAMAAIVTRSKLKTLSFRGSFSGPQVALEKLAVIDRPSFFSRL